MGCPTRVGAEFAIEFVSRARSEHHGRRVRLGKLVLSSWTGKPASMVLASPSSLLRSSDKALTVAVTPVSLATKSNGIERDA
jgi:hypothetical protein